MATVTPTITRLSGQDGTKVTWADMATGDTIVSHKVIRKPDRASVQAAGTFAGGTAIGLTGSNDGTNFAVLDDAGGTAISSKTAAFFEGLRDAVIEFKPTIASGSADSVTVTLVYWE